eukprot:gene9105-55469_t
MSPLSPLYNAHAAVVCRRRRGGRHRRRAGGAARRGSPYAALSGGCVRPSLRPPLSPSRCRRADASPADGWIKQEGAAGEQRRRRKGKTEEGCPQSEENEKEMRKEEER